MQRFLFLTAAVSVLAFTACERATSKGSSSTLTPQVAKTEAHAESTNETPAPTIQEAKEFLEQAEIDIVNLSGFVARAEWIKANFITEDTQWMASKLGADWAKLSTRLSNEAKRFNDLTLPADMSRKMEGLKRGSNFPAPDKDGAAEKLSNIMTSLDATYGTGKFEHNGETLSLFEASDIIASSRDPEELQKIWEGWRTISIPMKDDYARMVSIVNEGSRELGYKDTGALWRGGYDMDADAFSQEADRLWGQVKPLYDELFCHVRTKLNGHYGDAIVPLDQPIRADLLGNMWAQSWDNIYDIVAPDLGGESVDVTKLLKDKGYDQKKMVEIGEEFFTSLGFEALPQTFWERSLITKPRDREVVCHASAWDIDDRDDIRIKMCTKVNAEDFVTVHHELGHNFYQRAYKDQPVFYKDGANDGFHEAIGDMVALSITPDYLVKIGLLEADDVPGADAELALLMKEALDKIAFLPFGLMVDKWRWRVFNGEYAPSEYNSGWWELREYYQGVRPPSPRPENAFDPGAKYHIPGNTPYMRYFLARILQFQFHKAACDMAGFEGALHTCSIYGNEQVGKRLDAMLKLGSSKPWQDALEAFTGTRDMDGSAILEYFDPLMSYLKKENTDRACQ